MKIINITKGVLLGGLVGIVTATVAEISFFTIFGLTLFGDSADTTKTILYVLPLVLIFIAFIAGGIWGYKKDIQLSIAVPIVLWILVITGFAFALNKLNQPYKNFSYESVRTSSTIEGLLSDDVVPGEYSMVAYVDAVDYKDQSTCPTCPVGAMCKIYCPPSTMTLSENTSPSSSKIDVVTRENVQNLKIGNPYFFFVRKSPGPSFSISKYQELPGIQY